MKKGWIKLYRKMEEWDWYTDPVTCRLFTHMLIKANLCQKSWRGIEIDRGEFISGRKKLAEETGLTEQQVRTSVKKLKSTSDLTIKTTNRYSLFKLNNYNSYQDGNQPANQQATNKQPTSNQQLTTTKEDNNIRIKELKNIYTLYKNKINQKSKLTDKAKDKIRSRLKTYTEKELIQAISNFSLDDWWQENNSSRGVAWFFNSDDRIDQFLNLKVTKESIENKVMLGDDLLPLHIAKEMFNKKEIEFVKQDSTGLRYYKKTI